MESEFQKLRSVVIGLAGKVRKLEEELEMLKNRQATPIHVDSYEEICAETMRKKPKSKR
jgi:hypothetical protein